MDDQYEPRTDPDLADVWQDMDASDRLRLLLTEGEKPPPEVGTAVRRMYSERHPEA